MERLDQMLRRATFGSGIPLCGPLTRDVPLRHVETRTLANGSVQSEYLLTTHDAA